jgi:hypothetical protein
MNGVSIMNRRVIVRSLKNRLGQPPMDLEAHSDQQ